ncbi:hypothetical protein VA603_19175 [Stenotrophomonas sp. MH1]|uniref:Uncharacterized protein n=1 Tax=Stenotrophomonas capsici TaxID=3110230 RepID=A0ABU5VAE2_9GAMM|nr:hypothetical protein [Stenotrophomonas sp. MH1]MEA5669659.1 hypothetical protein [Stenotrophomonas sp. MH1]
MKCQVAMLNEDGIGMFRMWLKAPAGMPPREILTDPRFSIVLEEDHEIDLDRRFETTYELGRYLHEEVFGGSVDRLKLRGRHGLWAWISLAMIGSLLRRGRGKTGLPLGEAHYVHAGERLGYRLIARTAWEVVCLHGDNARLPFSSPASPWGDVAEQMTSRQEIFMHPSFWKVAGVLYLEADGRVKRGVSAIRSAGHRKNPRSRVGLGGLRRLAVSFGQFERTYLLRAMTAEQIIGILPREYGAWAPAQAQVQVTEMA